jgi:uncharacterized protein (TIGR04141 family)
VTDPVEIADFESRAAERLGRHDFAPFDLFPPELVSEEIVGYRIVPRDGGRVVIEPDDALLRLAVPGPMAGKDARAALSRYRLVAVNGSGDEVERWPFWQCLHFELSVDGNRLVLDDGRW